MKFCTAILALTLLTASGQQKPAAPPAADDPADILSWAEALAGRFREMHNPVIRAHALGRLAALVCSQDQGAGATLFREALSAVDLLPDDAFSDSRQVLPVSSLSGLWKALLPAAARCDPALARFETGDRIQARLADERQHANYFLSVAMGSLDDTPDRAAQLAEAALDAGDPAAFNMPLLTRFLAELRDRAPDLADDLFPKALDFVASAPAPSPRLLAELGKYLFTAPQLLERPDKDLAQQSYRIGNSAVPVLTATRHGTNPEDVKAYLDAAVTVLKANTSAYYDPVTAYAIGFQMLPKANELAPSLVDPLQRALTAIESQVASYAGVIQSAYGGSGSPDPEGGDAAPRRDRTIRGVFRAVGAHRFDQARDLLRSLDVPAVRGQIASLIDFAEAAQAISQREIDRASRLANGLRGGVKRSLLYAGIIAAANGDVARSEFQLAMKDSELMPAEHRIGVLSAITQAMLEVDVEGALLALNQLVIASNDAANAPRRERFEPRLISKSAPSTDSPLILLGKRGIYEVVDAGRNRERFPLSVPGVEALSLPAVVQSARAVDPARLEAILLELRDENQQAAALTALVALRLKTR